MNSRDWRETTIGTEVDLLTGNPFNSSDYTDDPLDIRLLRGDNVIQGRIRWDGVKLWNKSNIQGLNDYFLKVGDVVLAMDRPWIEAGLKYAAISEYDLPCLLVQRVSRLRGKENLDQRFLKYIIGSKDFTDYVLGVQTGTSVPHISSGQIKEYKFLLPPLPEQRAIARILGALDDKIELNRRMNHTLEEMARVTFKSWFVDFDPVTAKAEGRVPFGMNAETASLFPAEFEETEEGVIPKGWKVGTVGDIADVIDCLHAKKPEQQEVGQIFLQLNNIRNDGLLDLSEVFRISDEDYAKWISRIEASEGDCVITNVGRVGAVSQIPPGIQAALGRNMTAIRLKQDFPYPSFLITCLLSDMMKDEINSKMDTGTILNALNVKNIPLLRLNIAPHAVLGSFEKKLRPLRRKMEINLLNSQTLSSIRDSLLPKLMSGELRVKQAEKIIQTI